MITFSPATASITRRVAVGDCSGAQSADAVPELASTARDALFAAPWALSYAAPSMPVHDNGQAANTTIPSGDAWKCGYGYDATARTERSAAGAVCYSFQLPDAVTAAEDPAKITSLSVRVIGDRYLDAGARVYAALTANAEPPTFAQMLSAPAVSATVCATDGQVGEDGETPLAPNSRSGVREDAAITPGEPLAAPSGAVAAYLHICLALVDYATARGAWIEGGAMLAPDTISLVFDRDIAVSDSKNTVPLTLGRFAAPGDNAQSGPSSRRQDTYALTLPEALLSTLEDDSADERASHLLAAALQTPTPILGTASLSQHSDAAFGIGQTALASTVISRSGLVPAGTWPRIQCALPFESPCDAIAHVYAVVGPTAMTATAIDGAAEAPTASVCLDWASVIRRAAFVDAPPSGDVARLSSGLSGGDFSTSASVPFAMQHIGTVKLLKGGVYSEFPLSTPLRIDTASRELVTIIIQFAPVGPGGGIESVQTTERVLDTLQYADTYTVDASNMYSESGYTFCLGVGLTPVAASIIDGWTTPYKVEITGGNNREVYVSLVPGGSDHTGQHFTAYLPAGNFEVKGHSLHWEGQVFYFGVYGAYASVTPNGTTVVYDSSKSPNVNKTVTAKVPASAIKEISVPVFETIDGKEVPRGNATIRTRFLAVTISDEGGFIALKYPEYHSVSRTSNGLLWTYGTAESKNGISGPQIPQEISVEYLHKITESVDAFDATQTFTLPELSLKS